MTQNPTAKADQESHAKQRSVQQSAPTADKTLQPGKPLNLPPWPTSHPGPRATPVPAGMRPINAIRSEQVAEISYDQETGTPAVASELRSMPDESQKDFSSFDQQESAQDVLKRGKKRL